jgi:sugar O-acyltransferase (sialic acid O-acetyltransferase NeuD family)
MNKIILVGAGGQGSEVVQLIDDINRRKLTWDIIGFVDDSSSKQGQYVNGVKVIATMNQLSALIDEDTYLFVSIGRSEVRQAVIHNIKTVIVNPKFAILVHPTAVVADTAKIDMGSLICALTVVSTNVVVEQFVLINYGSTIGHDCRINDFATIAPGCRLSGNVQIGAVTEIGSGATIIQNLCIGSSSIVGAGATVIANIPNNCTAVGVPAKVIKISH